MIKSLLMGAVLGAAALSVSGQSAAQDTKIPSLADSLPKFGHHGDIVYGATDAPIEVIEYASMTCHHCGAFARDVLPLLKEKYIDTGRVRFVFRNFVLNQADMAIAMMSRCRDEKIAKAMINDYFTLQDTWLRAADARLAILSIAQSHDMDEALVNRCVQNFALQERIVSEMKAADETYKITGTPTLIVNGKKVKGYAWEAVDQAIAEAFAKSLTESR